MFLNIYVTSLRTIIIPMYRTLFIYALYLIDTMYVYVTRHVNDIEIERDLAFVEKQRSILFERSTNQRLILLKGESLNRPRYVPTDSKGMKRSKEAR